jgi:adenylylsulfate kinase-like enzyme
MSSAELAAASDTSKILLVLVGLPARGKSYVANKIKCFLRWRGVSCESFNVGAARRQVIYYHF